MRVEAKADQGQAEGAVILPVGVVGVVASGQ